MDLLRAVAHRAWPPPPPQPRPFWVSPGAGGRCRGVVATSLGQLREQAGEALRLGPLVTLVLAEDGTAVETEEFFRGLPPHTPLLALTPGQRWEPHHENPPWWEPAPPPAPRRGSLGEDVGQEVVARLSLSLAKRHPRDAVGQVRVTAAVGGLRWDIGGLGPHKLLRELLRLLVATTRAVGQSLLTLSAALRRLLDGPLPHGVTYGR